MSDAPLPPHEPEGTPPSPFPEPEPWPPSVPATDGRAMDIALQVTAAVGGLFVIFICYVGMQAVFLAAMPGRLRMAVLFGQVFGLLLPGLLLLQITKTLRMLPPRRQHAGVGPGLSLALATWTSGTALLAGAIVTSCLALISPEILQKLLNFGMEMLGPILDFQSPLDVIGIVLLVTVAPAICEEVVFRGYVQRILRGRLSAAWSVGLAAFLFSAVHLEPLGFLSRLILGIGLGVAYERTGSLRLPMLMHGLHNLVTVLLFPWGDSAAIVPLRHEAVIALLAAVPATCVAMFLWWRVVRALPEAPAPA